MAKVVLPLLGVTAHGSVKKSITYRDGKHGPTAARFKRPRDARSSAQIERREWLSAVAALWQGLSDEEKAEWSALAVARGLRMRGYNLFVREHRAWVGYSLDFSDRFNSFYLWL